jgi:hypothetical protein
MGGLGLLGGLFRGLFEKLFEFVAAFVGVKYATRMAAVTLLATLYLASVATFTALIAPWFDAIISTAYGQLLGLLFPPVAGTILAALMGYRMAVIAYKYTASLIKMAVG